MELLCAQMELIVQMWTLNANMARRLLLKPRVFTPVKTFQNPPTTLYPLGMYLNAYVNWWLTKQMHCG